MEELDARAIVDTRLNDDIYNNAAKCYAPNWRVPNLHAPQHHPTGLSSLV